MFKNRKQSALRFSTVILFSPKTPRASDDKAWSILVACSLNAECWLLSAGSWKELLTQAGTCPDLPCTSSAGHKKGPASAAPFYSSLRRYYPDQVFGYNLSQEGAWHPRSNLFIQNFMPNRSQSLRHLGEELVRLCKKHLLMPGTGKTLPLLPAHRLFSLARRIQMLTLCFSWKSPQSAVSK